MARPYPDRKPKNCEVCGNEMLLTNSLYKRIRCCSRECGYKIRKVYSGDDNVSKRPEVRIKISNKLKGRKVTWNCNGSFKPGSKHPYWKGGLREEKELRLGLRSWRRTAESVRERQDRKCYDCSVKEVTTGRKLAVHHIIPWRISKDNSSENLVALCYSCHRYRDLKLQAAV